MHYLHVKKKKKEFEKIHDLGVQTLVRQPSRELSSPQVITGIMEEMNENGDAEEEDDMF